MNLSGLFNKDWAEEIAEVSTRPEFQTSEIEIVDPSLIETEWDFETGDEIVTGDGVIYAGRARVIGISGGNNQNGAQYNPTTLIGVRVQIPREGTTSLEVRKGMTARVTSAPRQPRLMDYVFTAVSDFQGSSSAARTFEFFVDGDSVHGDS